MLSNMLCVKPSLPIKTKREQLKSSKIRHQKLQADHSNRPHQTLY
uniref:Uncharacterized protein MANES_16G111400 n=1 Tax=Rhizophora mucronata TaxID=61149 RepID=A0A2P2LHF2_RHIMU